MRIRQMLALLSGVLLVMSAAATASAKSAPNRRATTLGRAVATDEHNGRLRCEEGDPLCAETAEAIGYDGRYTGHDEPSLLFYSDKAGAGNDSSYRAVVPGGSPQGPADPAAAERGRRDLQLPGPRCLLVRHGALRQPVSTGVHPRALHAEQRQQHLRRR